MACHSVSAACWADRPVVHQKFGGPYRHFQLCNRVSQNAFSAARIQQAYQRRFLSAFCASLLNRFSACSINILAREICEENQHQLENFVGSYNMLGKGIISGDFDVFSTRSACRKSELVVCNISGICVPARRCFSVIFHLFLAAILERAFCGFYMLILLSTARWRRVFIALWFPCRAPMSLSGWGYRPINFRPRMFCYEGELSMQAVYEEGYRRGGCIISAAANFMAHLVILCLILFWFMCDARSEHSLLLLHHSEILRAV